MRTVAEHLAVVLDGVRALEPVEVALADALGQVLAADVVAPWPLPSFDNSSMDGYAVRADEVAAATLESPVRLPVLGDLAAGHPGGATLAPGSALRIMTGAPMPAGADAVVPVERTDGGVESVLIHEPADQGAFVRLTGEDVRAGVAVMAAGDVVTDRSLALLASVGCATVSVVRRPRVVVLSTGDELVDLGGALAPGQIVDSNGLMLTVLAQGAGADARRAPRSRDDVDEFRAALDAALVDADLVVTSGGVSMGAYDTVKTVLAQSGEVEYVKVAQQPGMPQGHGFLGSRRVPIVTLPGNPVSSYVSFELYVRPVIRRMLGHSEVVRTSEPAVVLEAFGSPAGKQQYVRGVLEVRSDGSRAVRPIGGQASHVMGGLAHANALLVVPPEITRVDAGQVVDVLDLTRSA